MQPLHSQGHENTGQSADAKLALAMRHTCGHRPAMQIIPRRRLIGVLGGMGPAATIDFMAKIVMLTPAIRDQEHVPLLVHDVPQIPDRSSAIATGSDAPFLPMLAGVMQLARSGAEVIAIPCNTAHHWHERLARSCNVPVLHIADAVLAELAAEPSPGEAIALLATPGTVSAGLYQSRFARSGRVLILPDEETQALIDAAIAAVKAKDLPTGRRLGEAAAVHLFEAGAGRLLLACTELPIAFADSDRLEHTIDATAALARACVQASFALAEAG
jgi:aspartate racemase